ncbi:hypothetical protein ACIOGZ_39120 [Kitasatospora sp. NPDC088160]|uniref:hypothetical protein n=1 Tax=Kitasatospora sp. NPDC088160 TaxID=3364072 RepID=UPI0038264C7C
MSEPDKFEDDLLYALTRTGEGFRTEPSDLLAGGYQRGRRRWRRRSTAAVVGGAAALALVGTGAVYLTGSSPRPSAVPAAAPSTAGGSGSGSAAPVAAASSAEPGEVTGEEVLATLRGLLPGGRTSDENAGQRQGGTLVFDDGRGRAAMAVSVNRVGAGSPVLTENGCPDRKLVPYDACTSAGLPGGGKLTLFQGYEYPNKQAGTKRWSAWLGGADGRVIELTEWNAEAEKGAPDSRRTPPLSPEQLRAVVTDKAWDGIIAKFPEPRPEPGPDNGKEYGKDEILAIVAKLLPSGLTETETGGQPGYANFVVDDGKGKSMVEINVQDWSRDDKTKEELFGSARAQPDGTRVVVGKRGSNPGMWTVDTLHADGLRVVISAFNSGTQQTPAIRSTPALSNDQLKAIATAPVWKLKK